MTRASISGAYLTVDNTVKPFLSERSRDWKNELLNYMLRSTLFEVYEDVVLKQVVLRTGSIVTYSFVCWTYFCGKHIPYSAEVFLPVLLLSLLCTEHGNSQQSWESCQSTAQRQRGQLQHTQSNISILEIFIKPLLKFPRITQYGPKNTSGRGFQGHEHIFFLCQHLKLAYGLIHARILMQNTSELHMCIYYAVGI